jgi:hypothetical protein
MKSGTRLQRVAISETVIEGVMRETKVTGRAQTIADSQCSGLRLVVRTSADPLWLLFCYGAAGGLEKRALGNYPNIGVDRAREDAWKFRLKLKGIQRSKSTRTITLERLFLLYESSNETSANWGRLKAKVIYALRPFVFRPWASVDSKKLQAYIDGYESPGNMRALVSTINKVIVWGGENGLIERLAQPLAPPKPKARLPWAVEI